MKKIALYTLYGLFNFGNRLQNYALQQSITSLGLKASTLVDKRLGRGFLIKNVAKLFLKRSNGKIRFKNLEDYAEEPRKYNFQKFNDKYIEMHRLHTSKIYFPSSVSDNFDFFVVGSDQVWNAEGWNGKYGLANWYNYTLQFAPPEKRIAYAASFSINKLPCQWEKPFAEVLPQFKAISVREETGAEIIRNLTGLEVPVVLDPTMLLTVSEWRKIETHTLEDTEKFILTYFLGPQSENIYREIEKKASDLNLPVINLMDYKSKYYCSGPDRFLELVDRAEIVYTDSFHGTVFSILFHKQFYLYQRNLTLEGYSDMGSRLDTLLKKTQLTERVRNREMITEEDFKKADMLIEKEREASMQFLRDALNDR